jgi:HEAT repeat protein
MPKFGEELLRLERLERDRNVPGLIQLLDSESKDTRFGAICALGRLRDSRAIPYLIERVEDSDGLNRSCACQALGVLRAGEAEELLLNALHDPDEIVRMSAADALCRLGDPEAFPRVRAALRESLDTDPDRDVRLAAAESLVVLGDKDARSRAVDLINGLSWLRRGDPRVKRLRAAIELDQPVAPCPPIWESLGPKRS